MFLHLYSHVTARSNLDTQPSFDPTRSIPLSDTTDVFPSLRTQTQQEVPTATFQSSKSRLTAKGDYYMCCYVYFSENIRKLPKLYMHNL